MGSALEKETRVGKPIDRDLFRMMVEYGMSKEEISHALRCSISSVSRISNELGYKLKPAKINTKITVNSEKIIRWFVIYGETLRSIADRLGISTTSNIRKNIKNRHNIILPKRYKPQGSNSISIGEELKKIHPRYLMDIIQQYGSIANAAKALGYYVEELESACYYHGFCPPTSQSGRRKVGYRRWNPKAKRKRGTRTRISMHDYESITEAKSDPV